MTDIPAYGAVATSCPAGGVRTKGSSARGARATGCPAGGACAAGCPGRVARTTDSPAGGVGIIGCPARGARTTRCPAGGARTNRLAGGASAAMARKEDSCPAGVTCPTLTVGDGEAYHPY